MYWFVGAVAITTGFTTTVGTVFLDNVACIGTESTLFDCPADTLGNFNCAETNAGIQCEMGKYCHRLEPVVGTKNVVHCA